MYGKYNHVAKYTMSAGLNYAAESDSVALKSVYALPPISDGREILWNFCTHSEYIYISMYSAVLFWRKFTKFHLDASQQISKQVKFELNKYNPLVYFKFL